jgi:hypothetical protein
MKPFISTITALALAGCVSTAGPVAPPISVLPDQLQSAITATCGVVLTAQSLSTVLSLVGGGGLSGLTGVAAQVCAALTGKARRAARPWRGGGGLRSAATRLSASGCADGHAVAALHGHRTTAQPTRRICFIAWALSCWVR